ncbi:thiamine pyrophosphate-dependent enzyme [Candidatus Bathyarchaeota archaeon]|nr:thiamine pyrophosphate-dependent enzyme [Candidatus Bathyarchaeota archaeon]
MVTTPQSLETPLKNNWCPGCGNFGILSAFKNAIIESGLEREQVVCVSGIGCHGKMPNWININGFHGIHGRVLPLAVGIKLANPELAVIGFAGDSDQYDEGWEHFVHAIRRNINITLIVHDNQVLGLTTGQTTSTSLLGFKSKSTPYGSITQPLNPIAHALVSNCSFVARGFAGDPRHLKNLILAAINHRGLSYIDVFQLCVTWNYLNTYQWFRERVYKLDETEYDPTDKQKALEKSFEGYDHLPIGVFYKEDRPIYRDNLPYVKETPLTKLSLEDIDITPIIKEMM